MIFLHRFTLQVFPSIPTRGSHPFNLVAHIYMLSVVPLVILVIVPGVQLYLTSDLSTISRDRTILRFATVYLAVFVAIQVPLVIFVWTKYMLSRKPRHNSTSVSTSTTSPSVSSGASKLDQTPPSDTGIPSPREVSIRAGIIFIVASLLTWIQAIKICQGFYTPEPTTAVNPPWFLRKPTLYAGFFLPELLIVIIFAVSAIRIRFLKPVREGGKMVQEVGQGEKMGRMVEGDRVPDV